MSDPRITNAAVEAAVDAVMDDGHNGLDCRPTRRLGMTVLAALEAALPHLAPQPVIDRDAIAKAVHQYLCVMPNEPTHEPDEIDYDKADEILEILALINGSTS